MCKLKTIKIRDKDYVEVNERLKAFRTLPEYKGYSLESEIIALENGVITIKAIIKDADGNIRATGLAQEKESSSFINKTSFVENCETSAWGRALGNLGIGIDSSIASAEEADIAIKKQEQYQQLKCECAECRAKITERVALYSLNSYGKELCYDCQKKQIKEVKT